MYRHNLNFMYAVVKRGTTSYNCARQIVCFSPSQLRQRIGIRAVSHRYYSQTNATCWSCQEPLSPDLCIQFTCLKCNSLLKIPTECNYFQLLGLNKEFKIDLLEMTKRYRGVQSILHPDKYSQKSEEEQNLSADWSSLINNAYKTLQSPIRRAEYLLKLSGVTIPESNSELNKEFLMEMMERNEEVDDANNAKELQDLLKKVRKDMLQSVEKLGKTLNKDDLEQAKADLITLRYFVSLENSIKEKGNRLGIHL